MRVALVYDRVNKIGGAERVLQVLHEIWPEAPIFASIYNSKNAPWARDWDIRTSFLQKIPWARKNHEKLGWLMPKAFASLNLSAYDAIISLTSEAAKGIKTNSKQLHICYLLTPTRYLWSHTHEYLAAIPKLLQPIALASFSQLRIWDYQVAQKPDLMITISEHVRKRCEKYYRRKARVIYPLISLAVKRSDLAVHPEPVEGQGQTLSKLKYFLVVSRLVPYKRVDLAIEVCNQLKVNLVIVGSGSDESRLKSMAGSTIQFTGRLTDQELIRYYQQAKALLMPQEEELGLVALEAQSFGLPVISYRQSGAAELIIEGQTGILFDHQNTKSLITAIQKFSKMEWDKKECQKNASRFSKEKFKKEFKEIVNNLWKKI